MSYVLHIFPGRHGLGDTRLAQRPLARSRRRKKKENKRETAVSYTFETSRHEYVLGLFGSDYRLGV